MSEQKPRCHLNIVVSPELRAKLDQLRGDVPMQWFVFRILEREVQRVQEAAL